MLLFYTAIVERRISETHLLPSIMDYEKLVDLYSDGVNCPCTYISMPYSEIITKLEVNSFHEMCEPYLVHDIFLSGSYDVFDFSMRKYFELLITTISKYQESRLNITKTLNFGI